jgi:PAS domain S-box-containing protein
MLKILMIEDLPTDSELIRREIRKSGIEFVDMTIETKEELLDALENFSPDIILSDYSLPLFDGKEALTIQQELAPLIPFILVTGSVNEETAVECMKAGADDYIIKQNLKRLGEAIKSSIEKKKLIAEKKEVEAILRSSEERYRSLFENSAIPIFEEDFSLVKHLFDEIKAKGVTDFRKYFDEHPEDIVKCTSLIIIRDVNEDGIRFFQASTKQDIFEEMMAGFLDETWPSFKEEIIALAEGKTYFESEIPVATFNFEHKDVLIKLSVRPDSVDSLKHVMVSFVDITPRKQVEAALAENEELFRTASENTIIGVSMMTTEGNFTYVNNAICTLWGYTREELLKMSFGEIIFPQDKAEGLIFLNKMISGEIQHVSLEQRYLHKNGSVIWATVSSGIVHSSLRRKDYFVSYIHDITERKQAEITIRQSAELYCTLTENMKDVIWIIDPETLRFSYLSPSATKLVGYSTEEIMSQPITAMFPSEYGNKLANDMLKIINDCKTGNEKPGTYHTQIIKQPRKDGSFIWAEVTAYAYQDQETGKLELRGAHRDITERRNTEEMLRKSEEKFRLLAENATDVIWTMDITGRNTYISPSVTRLRGFTQDEVLAQTPEQSLCFGSVSKAEQFLTEALAQIKKGERFESSHLILEQPCKNGSTVWVDVTINGIYDETGNFISFLGVSRDITDRKKAEEALKDSQERYRMLIENQGEGAGIVDLNEIFVFANPAAEQMFGVESGTLVSKSLKDFIPSGQLSIIEAETKVRQQGEKSTYELGIITGKGENKFLLVTATPHYNSEGKLIGTFGVFRDITERKKAEELLQERQFWLSESQRVGRIGSYSYDLMTNIWSSSEVLDDIFGISHEKEKNFSAWLEIIHPDHREEMEAYFMDEVIGKRTQFNKEYKIIRANDKVPRWVWGKGELTLDESGEPIKMIGTILDITERKTVEEALISAKEQAEENDRLKTAFLNNISHEIRTPMNAIIGFAGFLNEPNLQPEKRNYFTEIICNASNQLLSIITDIINIATIEAGQETIKKTKLNVNTILRNLYNQFEIKADSQKILMHCVTPLPDNETFIETDETKLVQVLTNLIGNAIKFTKQGQVKFGYKVKPGFLEFFVEDTGIGIPANMHKEIFDRFRQADSTIARQFGGTGLGLSISKAYIELLGGTIWLDSSPGLGSTFYCTIPFEITRNGHSTPLENTGQAKIELGRSRTLLIAEDEEFNYLLLDQILSGYNLNLIRVENGAEAVHTCKTNPDIDMVIMDVKMPVMDGYEATRLIKQFRPELPVIMQTAYSRESDREKAFQNGCDGYLSKPLAIGQFLELLKKHFDAELIAQ